LTVGAEQPHRITYMSDLLPTIAAYIPQSVTRTVLADPSPTLPTTPQTNRMQAAVLFADVSGFTPLTEALGQKGSEGPEELTRLLNLYLSWMISFVEAEGGEVVKFGGDALTVVFPATEEDLSLATRRAMQAAEAMRTAMDDFSMMETSVGVVALKMKFGIGAGELIMTQVGGLFNRWEFIVAGDALHQATQSENQAGQGEIILSDEAKAVIAPQTLSPRPLSPLDWTSAKNLADAETVLRCYIPGSVRSWLDGELHDWLATLRPMSVLFVSIIGLDYEQPDTIDELHSLLRDMQRIIYHYWGTLTRVTVDDKGTVLLILFGAPPYSHENDPERALRCALDLQALTEGKVLQLAIGVTAGRVFAGPVGGNTRREYTVMADAVNLAARLMVAAGPGRIYCNYEAYRNTNDKLNFETLPPIEVKGKAGLISVYQPTGYYDPIQLSQVWRPHAKEPIVGRQAELAKLTASLKEAQAGQSRIIIIEGEAGIGKSRLVEALMELTNDRDMNILLGMGLSIEQEKPYHAWRGIFAAFFGLDNIADTVNGLRQAEQQRRIQAQVGQVAPDLIEYLPLLNDIFNLDLPENELVASLDSPSREEKLSSLLLALLQSWAAKKPLVLILEDAHWLDPSSWKFAVQLAAASITSSLPLLLILVTRPLENVTMRTQATMLAALDETEYLRLDTLSADGTLNLATRRMGLTAPELPEAVAELLRSRAGGNPFFAEELFHTLYDNGYITFKKMQGKIRCLVSDDLDRAAQALPATIQSIILSRIDHLPPEKQLILRVAAVIGQTFAYTPLHNTLCKHLEIPGELLKDYLNDLIYLDLIRPANSETNTTYEFKHVIIREVAYQSLLFDRRRQLHRTVALWYENAYGSETNGTFLRLESEIKKNLSFPATSPAFSTPLAPYYPLLVYHWHQAEDDERELHYATLMGEQAVAQFANAEAVGYLNRALDLTQEDDLEQRYKLLLARETVYDRFGAREGQKQDLSTLAELVKKIKDSRHSIEVALRQANYAEAVSDYAEALEAAQQVIAQAKQLQDSVSEGKGLIIWGKTLLRQSNYNTAQEILEQALTLAQVNHHRHNEVHSLYCLAMLQYLQGDYPTAQDYCQEALTICRSDNYRLIQAHTLNVLGLIHLHLGDYPTAQDHFEQSILIYYTIGDRRGESKPFGNIGLIHFSLGDYEAARDYFEEALAIQRETNDRDGIADTLSNLGLVYCNLGDYNAARSYLGNSLEIRKEIGNQIGEADTLSIFGFVYHCLDDYPTTKRYCELALSIQQNLGNREAESKSLTLLGHALASLEQFQAAVEAYDKALRLRRDMGQAGLTIEILAGQAYIAIKREDTDQALAKIDELLAWIETNSITGVANPLWIYWTSYRVLNTATQNRPDITEQAQAALAAAYSILQEQASLFTNETLQRKFLNSVKINREIITMWEQRERLPKKSKQSQDRSKQSKPLNQ